MKKEYKIYLTTQAHDNLLKKAEGFGHKGRGSLSHFLEFLSEQEIAILDKNVKQILKQFSLK